MIAVAPVFDSLDVVGHQTPPGLTFRSFHTSDYERLLEIRRATAPEYPRTIEGWRHEDESRDPKCRWARTCVLNPDGDIVAYGGYEQSVWMYHPHKFDVSVDVHPEYQRRGVGAALYDHILTLLAPLEPVTLRARAREDKPNALRFLEKRGYGEEMRDWESRLNVAACDLNRFADADKRPLASGVTFHTIAELRQHEPNDYARKLYTSDMAILADTPAPDILTPPTFENWTAQFLDAPTFLPEAVFVARAPSGEYVGVSSLFRGENTEDLETGYTGVQREWRRKGIALALKVRAVRYAKAAGAPAIRTWNAQANRAMLSINEALGFEKQPAWISYVNNLDDNGALLKTKAEEA